MKNETDFVRDWVESHGVVSKVCAWLRRLGVEAFQPGYDATLNDDHKPFLVRGLPTILLIDFDYDVWHTTSDTPEHCSAASLGAVGRVVEAFIRAGEF